MKYTSFNSRPYGAHMLALGGIRSNTHVLDLGCATGYFAKALSQKNCSVIGVERDKEAAKLARKYCKNVIIGDLEKPEGLKLLNRSFDYVLLLDILEHIVNRERLLHSISRWLKPDGFLIISTPNIAHISIRFYLLFGTFMYTNEGILDTDHVHFFTKSSLLEFIRDLQYKVISIIPTADFGQLPLIGRYMRHMPQSIQFNMTKLFPTLLGVQFIAVCKYKRN